MSDMYDKLPEKPRHGEACNHCGLCCRVELCPAAQAVLPADAVAPCPMLVLEDGGTKAMCGLVKTELKHGMRPYMQFNLGIGDGCMLAAVPKHIEATGIEIDPALADDARERTGRKVITGDFLDIELPTGFTIAWGNPPFSASFMDMMLSRLSHCCVEGAQAGFIVPAYFLQSPGRVLRWNRLWSVGAEILPRTIFARLSKPIVFAIFTKDPVPRLRGLRLFAEAEAVAGVSPEARDELVNGSGLWRPIVVNVLKKLGGEAHLGSIYQEMAGRRPSSNVHWHAKVRQVLQRGPFEPRGNGVWKLAEAMV